MYLCIYVWQLCMHNAMYIHVGLQALVTISITFVTEERFGTGKQKSLIIFDPTAQN